MFYVKDLLAKFGVKMQTTKVGAYKSAPEMFIADKMSEPNREQTTAFITGIWNQLVSDVAASRHITAAQLNQYADSLITFSDPKNYVAMKFVDKLVYTDQVKDEVKAMMKLGKDDDLNTLSLSDMRNVKSKSKDGDEIAVYYAEGDIVDEAAAGISSARGSQIVGEKVCKDLQKLADDEKVKAVVLRINSGGGSAYASEQMWHAIEMLKAKKPVVVSMSGYAASGGYYMSCNSNWIVAEPTTLTGSIGIFGMFPDFSQLLTEKLGVKFDRVKTNAHSDFGTPSRPFSAEEVAYLEEYIDRGYELFRKRVADGRKMSIEDVEKIAQGHVWLGKDALKIKLVDELGGLDVAVAKAAKLAKLDKYYTSDYPAKSDFLDQLLDKTSSGAGSYIDGQLRATLGEYYAPFMLVRDINRHSAIQARIPYFINIK
jgi:protease-4